MPHVRPAASLLQGVDLRALAGALFRRGTFGLTSHLYQISLRTPHRPGARFFAHPFPEKPVSFKFPLENSPKDTCRWLISSRNFAQTPVMGEFPSGNFTKAPVANEFLSGNFTKTPVMDEFPLGISFKTPSWAYFLWEICRKTVPGCFLMLKYIKSTDFTL